MFLRTRKLVVFVITCAAALCSTMTPLEGQSPLTASDAALGQQVFSSCAACHGLDGRGGEHAPNIATDQNVQRMSDAAITGIIRNGIPAAGMPGFNKLLDDGQIRAVLQYLRVLQGSRERAKVVGDVHRGYELFFKSGNCAECHMVDGRGGFLAADLSGYGSGHSVTSIREAIIAPGQNLDTRLGTVFVVTRSGKKYRGIVRNEDNFSLQMQTLDGGFHLLDKTDLVQIEHESRSLMPSDYGTRLTRSELDDLISFLANGGGDTPKVEETHK